MAIDDSGSWQEDGKEGDNDPVIPHMIPLPFVRSHWLSRLFPCKRYPIRNFEARQDRKSLVCRGVLDDGYKRPDTSVSALFNNQTYQVTTSCEIVQTMVSVGCSLFGNSFYWCIHFLSPLSQNSLWILLSFLSYFHDKMNCKCIAAGTATANSLFEANLLNRVLHTVV